MANAQTLTLTPSNYNGNNISCFGAQDGSINLTITGGTPPYTILWSTGATTQNISNLAAGFYSVEVNDADQSTDAVWAEITLTEPQRLAIQLTASDYFVNGRHYNISLNGACNGSISVTVAEGTAPYTYNWEPYGQTTANLTNLCAGGYTLNVTDANGCAEPAQQDMIEPDRDDWQMNGNAGTNPASQFIGTTDNADFSIKTYNQERLRVQANGDLKINGLAGTGDRDLYVTANGVIQAKPVAYWTIYGNTAIDETQHYIGPTNNQDLIFKTGDVTNGSLYERMRISKTGNIAIGGAPQLNYSLVVYGKIGAKEVRITANPPWPDYVANSNYQLPLLSDVVAYFKRHKHLEGFPSAAEIETNGQELGLIQKLQQEKLEQVFLYLMQQSNRISQLQKQNTLLQKQNALLEQRINTLEK